MEQQCVEIGPSVCGAVEILLDMSQCGVVTFCGRRNTLRVAEAAWHCLTRVSVSHKSVLQVLQECPTTECPQDCPTKLSRKGA